MCTCCSECVSAIVSALGRVFVPYSLLELTNKDGECCLDTAMYTSSRPQVPTCLIHSPILKVYLVIDSIHVVHTYV